MTIHTPEPLKILILEDEVTDAELIERNLHKSGLDFVAARAGNKAEFVRALGDFAPDIMLCDYKLPDFDGLSALRMMRQTHPDVPVIAVTGALGDEAAAEFVKEGASDFVLKDRLARLPHAVEQALAEKQSAERRREADVALKLSEERFRGLVEQELSSIFIMGTDGELIYVNPHFLQMLGYSPHEVIDHPISAFLPDAEKPVVANVIAELASGRKTSMQVEAGVLRKDGACVDLLAEGRIANYDGKAAIIGVAIDITERRRAEEALRSSQQLLEGILNAIPVRVFWKDRNLTYLGCNAVFARDAGFSGPKDVVGKDDYQMAWRSQAELYRSDDRQVVESGVPKFLIEEPQTTPTGETIWLLTSKVPLRGAEGEIAGVLGTYLDVTERVSAERALEGVNLALKTLSNANQALVRASSEAELLQKMCGVVVDIGGYAAAWIGLVHDDPQKTLKPAAWVGKDPSPVHLAADGPCCDERGPAAAAIRTGQVQISSAARADPATQGWRDAALSHGYRSAIALPLKGRAGIFGVLVICSIQPDAFAQDEMKLLGELAEDISYGVDSLRDRVERERGLELLMKSMEATIQVLAATVEARDPYTAGHQRGVAALASAIAREMGMSEDKIRGLALACVVHDVGKIIVPLEILNKPGKLQHTEFDLVKQHVEAGYELLKPVEFPWPIAEIVHQHHERLDGSGYPRGLKNGEILPEARVLAVADVVEAMHSHRPYRPALGIEVALSEIESGKGRLYDPAAVDACVRLVREKHFELA